MLGGYRFLIAAAFGLSLLCAAGFGAFYGAVYAPEKRHYQSVGSNSGQTYPPDSPRNGLADVAGIDGAVESLIAKPQPRNTDEREHRDLAAQESMAVFAYWMFWAMILQTALAGGALIALVKDLRQNRESAELQLRAYVALKPKKGTIIESGPNVQIFLSAINYGQTPARNVEFQFATAVNPADWIWSDKSGGERNFNASIVLHPSVPSVVCIDPEATLSPDQVDKIYTGELAFFARGILHYDDVFGATHTTQVTFIVGKTEIGTKKLRVASFGNYAT